MAAYLVNAFIPHTGGGTCLEWKCRVVVIDTGNRFMMYISFILQHNNPFSFLNIGHVCTHTWFLWEAELYKFPCTYECVRPIHRTQKGLLFTKIRK